MPTFDIIRPSQTISGQTPNQQINPGIFAPEFQATRESSQAIGQVGQALTEQALKLQRAKDWSDQNSAKVKIKQGFRAALNDFDQRNDFENFADEFNAVNATIATEFQNNKSISQAARGRIAQEIENQRLQSQIVLDDIVGKKQLDKMRAEFDLSINSVRDDNDLQEADRITRQAFDNGLIDFSERDRFLAENKDLINANIALEQARLEPDRGNVIIDSADASDESKETAKRILEKERADLEKQQEIESTQVLIERLADPTKNINESLALIEALPGLDAPTKDKYRKYFIDQDFNLNKGFLKRGRDEFLAHIEKIKRTEDFDVDIAFADIDAAAKTVVRSRDGREEPLISLQKAEQLKADLLELGEKRASLEATALMTKARANYRLNKIGSLESKQIAIELMDQYSVSMPTEELSKAIALFDEIEGTIDSKERELKKHADDFLDRFPPGFFGELLDGSLKRSKKTLQKRGDAISKIDDPEKQRIARLDLAREINDKMANFINVNRTIDNIIRDNPDITTNKLEEEIMRILEAPLQKQIINDITRFELNEPPPVTITPLIPFNL